MEQVLTKEPIGYQWALPENLDIPRDELRCGWTFTGKAW